MYILVHISLLQNTIKQDLVLIIIFTMKILNCKHCAIRGCHGNTTNPLQIIIISLVQKFFPFELFTDFLHSAFCLTSFLTTNMLFIPDFCVRPNV